MAIKGLVLVAIAVVSCGPAAQPPIGDLDAVPKQGGELRVDITQDPYDWDITYVGKSAPNVRGLALVYNRLLGFKHGADVGFTEGILVPELAERWEVSPDARTFTFHLRKGVKFANVAPVHGRELTSADVKWTLEYRTRSGEVKGRNLPRAQNDFMFEGMEGVETPDKDTAVVRFKEPFVPFVSYAGSPWNPILAREVFEQDGHLKDRTAGTGPFILDTAASQKGTRWVFKRNPDYWDAGKPYLDGIRWIVMDADAAAFAAFQARQLDLKDKLAYSSFDSMRKGTPQLNFTKYMSTTAALLRLGQVRNGPLTDVRVRRAISLSMDRDELDRTFANGESLWAIPGAPSGFFTEEETRKLVRQDVNEAKRLLAEAGHASGVELEWPIDRDQRFQFQTLLELIQAQLKRSGITTTFKVMDPAEKRRLRDRGDYDIDALTGGTGTLNGDIDSLTYAFYRTGVSQNYSKVSDPELDKLLDASRRETVATKRMELIRSASLRILEMMWSVDLIYPPRWDVHHPHVKGYYQHFTNDPIPYVWFDR